MEPMIPDGDSWRHARITREPVNPDFESIILTGPGERQVRVATELVEVLGAEA